MAQRHCHHVNPAGVVCQGPPLKNREHCYWHQEELGRRMKAARARARSERVVLKLPVLDDLHGVHVGLMQLWEAVANHEIDHRSAQLLLSILRLAASNLKSDNGWRQLDRFGFEPTIMISNPDFEAQYDLPKGFDLSLDPEVAFPPPLVPLNPKEGLNGAPEQSTGAPHIPAVGMCGSDSHPLNPTDGFNGTLDSFNDYEWGEKMGKFLRDAASAPLPMVTTDTVEIADVYEREGQVGVDKCLARRERNRKRQERQARRRYYEMVARNHSVQMAAEKLSEEKIKAEAANLTPKPGFLEGCDALSRQVAERQRQEVASAGVASEEEAAVAGVGA